MKVLDKGEVTLINSMGGDPSVIAAARVSNGASYEEASKGTDADQKLINYLVKHRHGSPFEHATFQFYIKAPLFVRSEWHRHRIASYNEISGRYVQYNPEFYVPAAYRKQSPNNKQGSIEVADYDDWQVYPQMIIESNNIDSFCRYEQLIKWGVAKEMARMVLPVNLYTQFYMTVNARSLMNFLSLRSADDAMFEIRQYSLAMQDMFKEAMPLTYNAWEANGFIAP